MGLPELREKVEAEVKCQEHLRKILDSDPKMRAAIIFFAARNFLKYQVKILPKKVALCHYLQQQKATSLPEYDLVPETGKAKTITPFKLSNQKNQHQKLSIFKMS